MIQELIWQFNLLNHLASLRLVAREIYESKNSQSDKDLRKLNVYVSTFS